MAHQFFAKPCEIKVLFEAIEQIAAVSERLHGNSVLARITAGSCLPSPPDLYQRIMLETSSPTGSLARVGEIIETDVAMTAKVLNIVNSPFFGLANQSTSPSQAIALIGFEGLRSIVLAAGIFEAYANKVDVGDLQSLMNRSITVSRIAGEIGAILGMEKRKVDQCGLAGMLHEIGKLVLYSDNSSASTTARMVSTMVRTGIYDEQQAEEELFGCSHADAGAYLLSLWGFPTPVVEAVAFHHRPALAGNHCCPNVLTAVHLASAFATAQGDPAEHVDAGYLGRFGITVGDDHWTRLVACAQTASAPAAPEPKENP